MEHWFGRFGRALLGSGVVIVALALIGACSGGGGSESTSRVQQGVTPASRATASKISCTDTADCPWGATCVKGNCQCADTGSEPCSDPGWPDWTFCPSPWDSQNCGACGKSCNSNNPVCYDGDCRTCEDAFPETSTCNGQCVWGESDKKTCKTCKNCPTTRPLCMDGECSACEALPGYATCKGECVFTQWDPNNCGGCGQVCNATTPVCVAGQCKSCEEASPGTSTCNGACIGTEWDPSNCGGCGVVCDASTPICSTGQCQSCETAWPGSSTCNGTCLWTDSDPYHCGGCDVVCPGDAPYCKAGQCSPCWSGLTDCSGACVDVSVDPHNCGGCGVVCAGETPVCLAGVCQSCETAWPGSVTCNGTCVKTDWDPSNCGGCGIVCPTDAPYCYAGSCSACWGDMMSCDGVCTDVNWDPSNCGGCGIVCPSDAPMCQYGQCVGCPEGTLSCNGKCVPVDDANCGACGVRCNADLGLTCSTTSEGSACACAQTGTVLCDVCTDITQDHWNCGGCGQSCGPVGTCADAQCSCNGTVCGDSYCTDLSVDPHHCGSCDVDCYASSTAAGWACVAGRCQVRASTLIDDFQTPFTLLPEIEGRNGPWWTYASTGATATMAYQNEAMRFTATQSDFAGLGANLMLRGHYDALSRGYVGMRFKMRADQPTTVTLSLADIYNDFDAGLCGGQEQQSCYARFGMTLTFGGSPDWTAFTVYWSELGPTWWSGRAPFDPSTIRSFSFDVGGAPVDFLVDDVEFITE